MNLYQEKTSPIYFVIRDSWNQEIRIGNSKTRGFGLIKFEIEDLIYEQFKRKDDNLKVLEDFFEEKDNKGEEKLIKFDFSKKLYLKKEFKELYKEDKTPNKFIISLFSLDFYVHMLLEDVENLHM